MSFISQELSPYSGEPVILYTFNRGGVFFRYTTADEDKTISAQVYTSVAIKNSGIESNQDSAKNPINITMNKSLSFLTQFVQSPPSDIIQLQIQKYHETDPELEVVTVWLGRVINVTFLHGPSAEVLCEPVYTSIRRPVLRRMYQTTCPYVLYGQQCGVSSTAFSVSDTLIDITDNTISAAAWGGFSDGYFTGGYIDTEDVSGNFDRRFITNHVGIILTLNFIIPGLIFGTTVRAFPGCERNMDICINKFNNIENYGGFPWIPKLNPMTGDTIF